MKKTIFAFSLFIALSFCISSSKAAPGPWSIALNTETKECAGFWPGDEFVAYDLPEGWKSFFPKYDPETKKTSLVTEIGECDFKIREEEKCCQELGYKFVSDNIGKDQKTVLRDRVAFESQLKSQRDAPKAVITPYLAMIAISLLVFAGIILLIKWALGRKKKNEKERG
jgi:hypothetical protein